MQAEVCVTRDPSHRSCTLESQKRWQIFSEPLDKQCEPLVVHALNLLVLKTHDIERSRRFYEAMGLRFQPFTYGCGADSIQGPIPPNAPLILNVKTEGTPPPFTNLEIHTAPKDTEICKMQIGFFVGSVLSAVRAGINAGGTLLSKPAKWPYGVRAALADPDGHRVELSEDPNGRLTGDYPA
jgi:lactoylglutathione lyase